MLLPSPHIHAQLLNVGGGGGVNFVAGDRFLNPGANPAFLAGTFSVWTGLQGTEVMGATISASNTDMLELDGQNAQADHIFQATRVVLRILVGPFTMQ